MNVLAIGEAAIERLAERLDVSDPAASSHWQLHHRAFTFCDGVLSGLSGFGELTPPQHGLHRIAHEILQYPYRRLGASFPEFARLDAISRDLAQRQNRFRDLDMLRQAITIGLAHARLPQVFERPGMTALVIGDGFGVLSALILAAFPKSRVVLVNLTKTLLADLLYCRAGLPEIKTAFVDSKEDLRAACDDPDLRLIAIEARHYSLLTEAPVDVAFNIASMQEMTPGVVASYFECLRSLAKNRNIHFYCCNRIEKTLPDGVQSRFFDYPWTNDDAMLVDEECPWHQTYYTLRPPFYRRYDGSHWHRFVRLAPRG